MTTSLLDSAIYGGLFGTEPMRALFEDRSRLDAMLAAEAALARAQAALGVIPTEAAAAIAAAAERVTLELPAMAAGTSKTGQPITALVAALGTAAGPEAGRWVHWGATTQDIVDTALVLQLRSAFELLERDLVQLVTLLSGLARRHRDTPMAGRTFLQQALPVTFGYKVAIWLAPLLRHLERLEQLRPRVLVAQLGGAVGTLASLGDKAGEVAARFAAELGLGLAEAPWHVARDGIAETGCLLGLVAGSLSKFAGDVVLMAQTEVGELAEGQGGGSSTMPQKRNPIAASHIIAAGRGVQALVPLILNAQAPEHERAAGAWQSEALALAPCLVLTAGALAKATVLTKGLVVDAGRMRRNLDMTGGLIMAEAVMLALAERIGRQEAHHAVERACAAALADGRGLAELLAQDSRISAVLDRAAIEDLLDPARYLGQSGAVVDRVTAQADALLADR